MKEHRPIHPAINELKPNVEEGKLSRREFLRYASLLGMSAVARQSDDRTAAQERLCRRHSAWR